MNINTKTTITRALKRHNPLTLTTLAAVIGSASVAIAEPETNSVTAVEAHASGANREIVIKTTKAPTFSVFRMTSPLRLLVDISNTEVAGGVTTPTRLSVLLHILKSARAGPCPTASSVSAPAATANPLTMLLPRHIRIAHTILLEFGAVNCRRPRPLIGWQVWQDDDARLSLIYMRRP